MMRKSAYVLLTMLVMLCSCNIENEPVTAGGKPYEVFFIAPRSVINSSLGDTLKAIFAQPVEWINQDEKIYDLYSLTPETMSPVIERSRNLIFADIDRKYDSVEIQMINDEFIAGQLCFHITSPDIQSATDYIWRYHKLIVGVLDKTERDRFIERLKSHNHQTLHNLIRDTFNFDVAIPKDYKLRNAKKDFVWISKEMPESSQGVIIYRFSDLPMDSSWLVSMRNKAVNQVPGPSDGSYMSTSTEFYPESHSIKINGRDWWETRGFWNVEGDFMGGPFVNYVTKYEDGFIGIDLYIYSPSYRHPKRNYIRQLEAIPLTASFDE